jgi:hypothetical protein
MKKASEGKGGVTSGSNQKKANQNSEEIVSSIIYREDVGQTQSLEFLGRADENLLSGSFRELRKNLLLQLNGVGGWEDRGQKEDKPEKGTQTSQEDAPAGGGGHSFMIVNNLSEGNIDF